MNTIIITVDSRERDRLFARTVRAMRQGLGITVTELSMASGIPCRSIEAIEATEATEATEGTEAYGTMTHTERHNIATALSRLSSSHAAVT